MIEFAESCFLFFSSLLFPGMCQPRPTDRAVAHVPEASSPPSKLPDLFGFARFRPACLRQTDDVLLCLCGGRSQICPHKPLLLSPIKQLFLRLFDRRHNSCLHSVVPILKREIKDPTSHHLRALIRTFWLEQSEFIRFRLSQLRSIDPSEHDVRNQTITNDDSK